MGGGTKINKIPWVVGVLKKCLPPLCMFNSRIALISIQSI